MLIHYCFQLWVLCIDCCYLVLSLNILAWPKDCLPTKETCAVHNSTPKQGQTPPPDTSPWHLPGHLPLTPPLTVSSPHCYAGSKENMRDWWPCCDLSMICVHTLVQPSSVKLATVHHYNCTTVLYNCTHISPATSVKLARAQSLPLLLSEEGWWSYKTNKTTQDLL